MSLHRAPYCWSKNKYSQDDISKLVDKQIRALEHGERILGLGIKCPGCQCYITNQDVTEPIQLHALVSIVRSGGSKLPGGLWG